MLLDRMLAALALSWSLTGCTDRLLESPPRHPMHRVDFAPEVDNGRATYYAIRRDESSCPSPACGGWLVRELNPLEQGTLCAEGDIQDECYVATATTLDDLPAAWGFAHLVVRGRLTLEPWDEDDFGALHTVEVWAPTDDRLEPTADDIYYGVIDEALVCLDPDCQGLFVSRLNRRYSNCADGTIADAEAGELCHPALATTVVGGEAPQGEIVSGLLTDGDGAGQLFVTAAWIELDDGSRDE
jgi:hypothetical protein